MFLGNTETPLPPTYSHLCTCSFMLYLVSSHSGREGKSLLPTKATCSMHPSFLPPPFSSWQLSPNPFSILPYSPGKPNPLRTPSAFFHPELLPHPFLIIPFPIPFSLQATQPGIFHLWCMDRVLDGLSETSLGLSAYDLWAPRHQAASPALKSHG